MIMIIYKREYKFVTIFEQDPTGQKYGRMDDEGGLGADKERPTVIYRRFCLIFLW